VIASAGTLTAGVDTVTITVTARDANGNVIAGLPVTLAATGTGNTLTQPAVVTDVNGVATGSLASTVAAAKTVSATIDGTEITQTAAVTVTAGGISVAQSTVAVSASTIAAAVGSTDVTVTVRDAFGNGVAGATVVIAATGTGNTVTQPLAVTDANGVATGSFSSTVSEAKTISATADGNAITQTAAVTVVPDAASAAQSSVATSAATLVAGAATSTITVTARDANGNPISGVNVVIAATGTGNTITQPVGTTDANGVATGTFASTGAGIKTVSATVNGITVTQTVQVTVTPAAVSADSSLLTVAPASIEAATGSSTITVTARDGFGNVIAGLPVTVAATGAGNTVTQPTAPPTRVASRRIARVDGERCEDHFGDDRRNRRHADPRRDRHGRGARRRSRRSPPRQRRSAEAGSTVTVTARRQRSCRIRRAARRAAPATITQPVAVTNASGVATGTWCRRRPARRSSPRRPAPPRAVRYRRGQRGPGRTPDQSACSLRSPPMVRRARSP
jgi:hypothetical protein